MRPQRPAAAARSTVPSGGGRPDRVAAAASGAPAEPPGSGWRTFWTAVDASAWLGTVGASVAFVLTQEAMLAAAPIVLPLLALYASRQREQLVATEESAHQLARLEELLLDLQADTADEVAAEVGAEVQDLLKAAVAAAAQRGGAANGEVAQLVRALEAKLSAVEGSVLSAGTTTREALAQSTERQGQLANSVMSRLQDLGTALRRDVNGALTAAGAEEAAALGRLEARLASLEGAIGGLQAAQADGLRRLNTGLAAAVDDAQATLEAAVRDEAARSLDPLRRLPELVAAAMPVTPEVLGPDSSLPAVSEESLRQLLGEQLAAATQRILQQQEALLEELAGQPQVIAPQQWTQLGGRLAFLQEQLEQLAALQQQQAAAAAEAGSSEPAAAAAAVAAVSAELSGLRSELGSLSTSVQQLLEAQTQQAQQAQQAAGSAPAGSLAAASGLPPGALAGVAAALQAVQDQVILLRQDLDEEDSKYAAFRALEEQLEVALTALFEALAVAEPSAAAAGWGAEAATGSGSAAAAAATAAMEQQQAALAAALESLAALGGRLDGMAEQMASLQASLAAAPAAAAQPAAPQLAPAAAVDQQAAEDEAWEGQQQEGSAPAPAAQEEAAAPVAAAGADGADPQAAAYQRMQQLLQQRNEERPAGAADEAATSSGRAFAEWLSGHRENAEAAAVAAPSAEALLAAAGAAEADTPISSASAASDGATGVQQQIDFAAAMGFAPEEPPAAAEGEPTAWVPPSAAGAVEDAAASAPAYDTRWQAESSAPVEAAVAAAEVQQQADVQQSAQEQQWYAAAQPEAAWQQAQQGQAQQPYVTEQQYQQQQQPYATEQYAAEQPPQQYQQPADQLQPQQPQLQQQTADELYERGVQRLREGRALAATPGADLGLADAAFWEAEEAFEALLAQQPGNIRALGNYGNTLNAHGKLKKQMMESVAAAAAPADAAQAAAVNAARERLAAEAQELLLLAGRKYRDVLQLDPKQAKAFVNWGRVVGLRAEMARAAGDAAEGARLFSRAADKFDAALDIEPQKVEAFRLGGQSLVDAGLCMAGYDAAEAKQLVKDSVTYFESALALDPADVEAAAGLERAQAQLAALREARRAAQAAQQ
ncbi:hypothetical protein C2E21_7497 [Chlorella sorokiniana]|uniref:Uncharacterized protein n=1 Tax=Chlorella sorokiniana TaxID=3076 RepID=A0A2P6TH46_CHLSO|nr:hypothetical protein C2E21_7497 [Chlorella sorokiniana]|eukprot:PRW33600.1 hypothetical protein C2E21_7497 [Chlorella sorokiniana]